MNAATGGGQSWLVGLAGEIDAESSGVQATPSLGPPLHSRVVVLQMGHGWILVGSVAPASGSHVPAPPLQFAFVVQKRPASMPLEALQREGRRVSPVR